MSKGIPGIGIPIPVGTPAPNNLNKGITTDELYESDKQPVKYEKLTFQSTLIDLSNTFTDKVFNLQGNILWVIDSTNRTTDKIDIRLNDFSNAKLPAYVGFYVSGSMFSKLIISNPTAVSGATLNLITSFDRLAGRFRLD